MDILRGEEVASDQKQTPQNTTPRLSQCQTLVLAGWLRGSQFLEEEDTDLSRPLPCLPTPHKVRSQPGEKERKLPS